MQRVCLVIFVWTVIYGCGGNGTQDVRQSKSEIRNRKSENGNQKTAKQDIKVSDTCELEKKFIANGLVDITSVIPDIKIDLRYSTPNNFMRMDLYGDLARIYILPN